MAASENHELTKVLTRVADALERMNTQERDEHTERQQSAQEMARTASRIADALETLNTQLKERTKG
jgi:hypothetical protein